MCNELGPPEKLVVEEVPDLEPRDGHVVVAVRAAGVNFVDGLFVSGDYQIKPPIPFTPGSEIAGEVLAVAPDVSSLAVGDRVFAMTGLGGYAGQVAISAMQAIRMPSAMDFGQAATFVQSYCTALFALRDRAGLSAGETVLVLGAGGGIGLAAIDVAHALGAKVIAAASSEEKRAAATAAGAAHVIDYVSESVKDRARELTDGDGVDVVLDPVGGDQAEASLRALRLFGRYIVIGFASGTIPRLPLNQVLLRNRSIIGVDWGAWSMQHAGSNNELITELLSMVVEGTLTPAEPTTYPLEEAGRALDDLLHRRATGKVALIP